MHTIGKSGQGGGGGGGLARSHSHLRAEPRLRLAVALASPSARGCLRALTHRFELGLGLGLSLRQAPQKRECGQMAETGTLVPEAVFSLGTWVHSGG